MARILLFDVDMTLINTNRAGRTAIDAAFRQTFGIEAACEAIAVDGRTDHAIFMEAIVRHHLAGDDPEAACRQAAAAYLAILPATIRERDGEILPGVASLLDALAATHSAVGLATGNMRAGAAIKLGHFGLWKRFAGGGFGDDSPVRADVVRAAIESLTAILDCPPDPSDCVVIGDPPLDVEAAHLAGARALGVATGRYGAGALAAAGADHVVESLADTPAILAILRA